MGKKKKKNYCSGNGRVEKEWSLEMGLRRERFRKKWFRAGGFTE